MLPSLNSLRARRDADGFTLIELLIVVIIIGLLAAIALPIFIDQTKTSVDASVKSDVRNTVTNVSNWRVDHRADVAANSAAYKAAGGTVAKSRSNSTVGVVTAADGSYTVCGFNPEGKAYAAAEKAWTFDSTTGKFNLTASSTCPGAVSDAGEDLSVTPVSPTLTTTSLPDATQNAQYTGQLVATGTPSPKFSVPASGAGSLPVGLALDPTSGAITGKPTAAGASYTLAVTVKNAGGEKTQNVSLTVKSAATATTATYDFSSPVSGYFAGYVTTGGNGSISGDKNHSTNAASNQSYLSSHGGGMAYWFNTPLEANRTYTFKVWIYRTVAGNLTHSFYAYGPGGSFSPSATVSGTASEWPANTWKEFSFTITPDRTIQYVNAASFPNSGTYGQFYIDDLSMSVN